MYVPRAAAAAAPPRSGSLTLDDNIKPNCLLHWKRNSEDDEHNTHINIYSELCA